MKTNRGYTLIEVLFAVGILLIGVAAAAALGLALSTQEEISWKTAVAMNHQEQAARLWQLGLSPTESTALLPETAIVSSLAITAGRSEVAGIGEMDQASSTMVFQAVPDAGSWAAGLWTAGSQSSQPTRTNTVVLARPDTR